MQNSEADHKSNLDSFFNARTVAVVGASTNPDKLGHVILANILFGGYTGRVYPINPKEKEILGSVVLSSIDEIPEKLDLVVIVVPAALVPGVLRQAAAKGAGAAIIISGGFREAGRNDLEKELLEISVETGIRIIGPNCQGINYIPNKLCASWPLITLEGSMAVISQSGTVAATIAGWAEEEGWGISTAVSLGNQIDVNETDLINALAGDDNIKSIALYLEGAKDGRKFLAASENLIANKPLIVLKSGRTAGGQRAAASHTKSLAGRDEIFDAACRQTGVVRANDIESLYDMSKALASLQVSGGNRLMVITSSGGSGILAVDNAEKHGLSVPTLPEGIVEKLRQAEIPANATLANPLDLTVATALEYRNALKVLVQEDLADLYLLIFGDPIPGAAETAAWLREQIGSRVAVAYLGGGLVEKEERVILHQAGIPVFPTPERAVVALGSIAWLQKYKNARKSL
ncbi:MAG TPA: CoA-binding protein [Anaerolineaceae bacterium]|nr:CoA-binding protein [Anaerolineaceae bacterium]